VVLPEVPCGLEELEYQETSPSSSVVAGSQRFVVELLVRGPLRYVEPFEEASPTEGILQEHLLKVTPATLCPMTHCQDYRVLPIHTDPFVHLSPLIFAIVRLQGFLWDELHVRMFCYLCDKMIVSALIETNNMY
jgi:hypothetical protein